MPPRRSTRSSARLSVEPENNPPAPSKRKRSSGDGTDIDLEDRENLTKPPSRTTRRPPSSKPAPSAPASRASSRSKGASKQVQESDDDGEPSHPVKRPRPSPELDGVREEDEEEDVKPIVKPRTRGASVKPVTSSTNGKPRKEPVAAATEDCEADPEREVKPSTASHAHSSGPSSSSLKPSTSRRAGRSSRSAAVRVKTEPPDELTLENNDVINDEIPACSQRNTARSSSRNVKPSFQSVEDEGSGFLAENANAVATGADEEDTEPLEQQPTPVPSPKKLPSTMPSVYEEEKSLLDDLPTSPTKSKRVPPPVEESQGPKPRLVIHKLVLVNFKSYAGRQEIGPFHKVGCFRVVALELIIISPSLQSSDPMVLESRILSMHCFSCLDTARVRCDKGNSPSSFTTLHTTLICKNAVWRFISVRSSTSYVHCCYIPGKPSIIAHSAWSRCLHYCSGLHLGRGPYCV
jgi:structural maintenance of chromosome 4